MRRVGVLLVLLAVMLGVSALKAESATATDPMTLAAIGFVLLAAFTVAEMGTLLSLPRVTGYIVTGTLLGPSVADILSRGVVDEMRMFNTLALGLIATAAGLELDARQITRLWKTLLGTIAIKVLLGVVVVGGTVYIWELLVGSLSLDSPATILAVALVFGTLSIGTSPAIALAVTAEVRAKGRLSDLVLGAAVLKDLVVVVALALSLAVAQGLVGAAVAGGHAIMLKVASELGASIGIGSVLGVLLILYLRYVKAEMLLFVAAMILVVAEVSRALHLELLLVFITAGFFVRNFSRHEHDLMRPVQLVALPVFVVFFTNAGAGIDLGRTSEVLPLAVLIAAARASVYYVAGRVGGALGGESQAVRRGAWLGYLPQAGVTLGLVGIAATQLPSLSDTLLTLGMATVAVNLLVGPITLRLALRRAGEVQGAEPRPSAEPLPPHSERDAAGPPVQTRLEEVLAATQDRRIATYAGRVAEAVDVANRALVEDQLVPWAHGLTTELEPVLNERTLDPLENMAAWSAAGPTALCHDRSEFVHELFRRTRQELRHLPEARALPYLPRHYEHVVAERANVRWKRRWLRVERALKSTNVRMVPVATCARVSIEARFVRAQLEVLRRANLAEAAVLADLQRVALGHLSPAEALHSIVVRFEELLDSSARDMERARVLGIQGFIGLLEDAGAPSLPLSSIRYSSTEAEVRELLLGVARESEAWAAALQAARNAVHLAALVGGTRRATRVSLAESVIQPIESSVQASAAALRGVEGKLLSIRQRLVASPEPAASREALQSNVREAFSEAVWADLERNAARFRSGVSTHRVALDVRRAIESLPQRMLVADARILAAQATPERVPSVALTAAALWQETLLKELLPAIEEDVRRVAVAMVTTTQRLREAEEIAVYALEQLEGEPDADVAVAVGDALGRAAGRLAEQAETLNEAHSLAATAIPPRVEAAFERLGAALLEPAQARDGTARRVAVRSVQAGLQRFRALLHAWREALGATVHRVGKSDLSRDLLSRYRKAHLDAVSLHEHVVRHTTHARVPGAYAKLFSLEPLVGPRLFVAYRRELEAVIATERSWLEGGVASALIVGAHGTGRTSLLNQCKLELSAPRVIRPETLQWRRDLGLLAALGVSLATRPTVGAIAKSLTTVRTTIIVDDLEQWFAPDLSGMTELERFLDLVVRTAGTAFWVVSVEATAFALFQEVAPLAHAFGLLVRLEPLSAPGLRAVIDERHRMSGRTLRHGTAPLSAVRNRIPGLTDQEVTWRVLAGLSDGNLSRALSLWLQSIVLGPDDSIEVTVQRLLRAALPFVGWLEPRDQAVLTQLLRFGPLRQSRLVQLLGFARTDVVRRLAFLRAAGLVEGGAAERDPARIPIQLRPTVLQGLRVFQVRS